VAELFERLAAILGSGMANVYASADPQRVREEWAQALAGFTADEVKRGLAACRTRKFAPALGEFLHLCRPALDPEVAWIEAERGMAAQGSGQRFEWSHPAVYWAARELQHELRSATFAQCRKRWDWQLAREWEKGAWADPPDPTQVALPAPKPAPTVTPEQVAEARARLRAISEAERARRAELAQAQEVV